jgi:hypothetical protein
MMLHFEDKEVLYIFDFVPYLRSGHDLALTVTKILNDIGAELFQLRIEASPTELGGILAEKQNPACKLKR